MMLRDFLQLEQQNVAEQTARNIIDKKRKTQSLAARSFTSTDDTTEFDAMMQTGVFQIPTDMLNAFKSAKPEPPKKVNQVQALTVGDWVNFGQNDKRKLAKLAWKSEDATLFIFVDREGKRVREVDASELSLLFESGELSLTDTAPVDNSRTRTSFMKTI